MKISKKQFEAEKALMKKAYLASMTTGVIKGVRKTANPDQYVEVKPDYISWSRFLKGAMFGDWTGAEAEVRLVKALGQDVNTRGGFLVPAQLSNELIPFLQEVAIVRSIPGVTVVPMTSPELDFGRVENTATITWGAEGSTISEDTTLSFGNSVLRTQKATCLYKTSRELIMNANPSVDGIVRSEMGKALALDEDRVVLIGTGGTQPRGLLYNPEVNSTDLSGTISADDVKEGVFQVRQNGFTTIKCWVCSPRTAYDLARLKDANGRYIYTNNTQLGGAGLTGGELNNLHGIPLKQTTKIPDTNIPSSNETAMFGGDWSSLIIGEEGGLRIETSEHVYWTTDEIGIRLVKRMGVLAKQPRQFTVIKGIQTPA